MSFISTFIKTFIRELDKEFPYMDIDVDFWDELYSDTEEPDCKYNFPLIEPSVYLDENFITIENKNKDEICCICVDNYEENKVKTILPCTHFYHQNCISKWIENNNTCPYCRCNLINITNNKK